MSSVPVQHVSVFSEPSWVSVPCIGCEAALIVPAGTTPLCNSCRKSAAVAEAQRLAADAEDLIHGRGVFACLRVDERAEQLAQLFNDGWVCELSDDDLISLVGLTSDADLMAAAATEIGRRIDARPLFASATFPRVAAYAPPADVRQALEDEAEQEARERTVERELAESGVDEGHDGIFA